MDTKKSMILKESKTHATLKPIEDDYDLLSDESLSVNNKEAIKETKQRIEELKVNINVLKRFRLLVQPKALVSSLKSMVDNSVHYKNYLSLKKEELIEKHIHSGEIREIKIKQLTHIESRIRVLAERIGQKRLNNMLITINKKDLIR